MPSLIRFSTSSYISGIIVASCSSGKVVGQKFDGFGFMVGAGSVIGDITLMRRCV